MILEPASDATLRAKHRAEQDALVPSTSERAILNAATPQVEHVPKKKRGPKGPNPLSVKKKKPSVQEPKKANFASTAQGEQVEARGKRKRDESDSNGEASLPRPKPRRRRKTQG